MRKQARVLIIGNGFGGVYTLKNLYKYLNCRKEASLAMVGEKNYFLFTPLLHEVATGSLSPENIIEPIRQVLGQSLDAYYLGRAESIDLSLRTATLHGEIVPYDYLVLAMGATTNFFNTPGAEKYAFTLKNIEDAIKIKNQAIRQIELASRLTDPEEIKKLLRFVVIGGGPTGVEFVAELAELIRESFSKYYTCDVLKYVSVILIQKGAELVPQLNPKLRKISLKVLKQKSIDVRLNTAVREVGDKFVELSDGNKIEAATIIWLGGVKPAEINFSQPVERSPDQRIVVNEFLQVAGYPEVFALGDMAAFTDQKTGKFLPALAQVAQKQAGTVALNIARLIKDKPLKPFRYRSAGTLISLGQWMAAGEIGRLTLSGHFTWWLWRTTYLIKFISFRKKIRVAIDWTMNLFSPRDISEF